MPAKVYRVGKGQRFHRLSDAIRHWRKDAPVDAVIELTDTTVYVEPVYIDLAAGNSLQLRAANRTRPVVRLLDWQTDLPNAMSVTVSRGSRFVLDGLLITGRAVQITGASEEAPPDANTPECGAEIVIRHCTLVPGWGLDPDCAPKRPAEPSLELYNVRARVRIEHSIVGSIQVHENQVTEDPIPMSITDSIVDAVNPQGQAVGGPGGEAAFAVLTIARCTVFGIVDVFAIELAENSIFNSCLNVLRRQLGCMRFCYVPPGCRTPKRYHCQPDLVEQEITRRIAAPDHRKAAIAAARLRLRPQFNSDRYGAAEYAQLALTCADEIVRGADDASEMGVFHDLFQPQRCANLAARLDQFTPAGFDVGIIISN
jgi:hypothetical protein